MNTYEQKQAAKRERLLKAAERAETESTARFARARAATAGIEPGQPILVGHHSEKRHRAALNRHDANMRKGIDAEDRAKQLRARAGAIGSGGISSDDPEAVEKLAEKRTDLEVQRDEMKAANAYYKLHNSLDGCQISDAVRKDGECNLRIWVGVYRSPFPSYALSNIGARIRQAAKRAESIASVTTANAGRERVEEACSGATIIQDFEENRVLLRYAARLSKSEYQTVRRHGFVWSGTRNAFLRKLSPWAVELARQCAGEIFRTRQETHLATVGAT